MQNLQVTCAEIFNFWCRILTTLHLSVPFIIFVRNLREVWYTMLLSQLLLNY